jgi:upstream-binding transcription factor
VKWAVRFELNIWIHKYILVIWLGFLMQIKKENPEAEFKDISNILGTKWKTVTAEEKKPYEENYLAEKEAYLQVIAKEKRETEAMKLFDEEHKQKTAMELLEQYLQFKQEAEKENKKTK